MSKTFSTADVASHKDAASGGMLIIIDTDVYDVTSMYPHSYSSQSPGPKHQTKYQDSIPRIQVIC